MSDFAEASLAYIQFMNICLGYYKNLTIRTIYQKIKENKKFLIWILNKKALTVYEANDFIFKLKINE